ncbi:Coiled-coil domain-containing protein 40-like protein [Frankliniella fusca]|uniref:Coiled-coil domain-containing protein 40-like protein n=1 Tax=Frankliniella fusca TaxID=407009 RepID=A0AAE1L8J1_9NEOP|nr:Coiled-coil domain-containing protein 40-like protein [Frankliniella fusca]
MAARFCCGPETSCQSRSGTVLISQLVLGRRPFQRPHVPPPPPPCLSPLPASPPRPTPPPPAEAVPPPPTAWTTVSSAPEDEEEAQLRRVAILSMRTANASSSHL